MDIEQWYKEQGIDFTSAGGTSVRDKCIYQAEQMLAKLDAMNKANADSMNYTGSSPKWWAGKATGDKRAVSMYYNNKRFKTAVRWADNNVKSVMELIAKMHGELSMMPEAVFEAEEKRRAEVLEKNKVKKS